ncbi:MAG: DUF896 domain-containing protein [Clostridia bacterium]|nr:DUF896 domain-containing protein [Clostridia bacterium]
MEQVKLDRINQLARLSRERALTEEELAEQAELRAQYIAEIRLSLGGTLDHTVIQRPDGTKEKLKKN